jgi:hypothetical protein
MIIMRQQVTITLFKLYRAELHLIMCHLRCSKLACSFACLQQFAAAASVTNKPYHAVLSCLKVDSIPLE